jgi:hypothetical protein
MSDEDIDQEFRRMADSFIHLANQHGEKAARENVSMALLYAAARYNAFVVSTHAATVEDYDASREKACEFFLEQYRKVLAENLDDYRKVYDADFKYSHLMKKEE